MSYAHLLDRTKEAPVHALRAVVTEMTDLLVKSSSNIVSAGVHPTLPLMTIGFYKPKDPTAPTTYYVYEAPEEVLAIARDANKWEAMVEDPAFSMGKWRPKALNGPYSHPFTMEDED